MVQTETGFRHALWLLALLPLMGCDNLPGGGWVSELSSARVPPPVGAVPAAPALPTDPLAQFAISAAPGTESSVTLASGGTVRARVGRRYVAASGRDCREVLLGSGVEERTQLVCAGPEGTHLTPPLLRGGGAL